MKNKVIVNILSLISIKFVFFYCILLYFSSNYFIFNRFFVITKNYIDLDRKLYESIIYTHINFHLLPNSDVVKPQK